MESSQQSNGNSQLNATRDSFNNKVSKLSILGKSRKVAWDARRRCSSI